MNKWFLIYCKPQQELRADENLTRQGFEVFRPIKLVKQLKLTKGNTKKDAIKTESLFPRYLFINVNPNKQSISTVPSTFGVVDFVKFGNRYATAPNDLIEQIKFEQIKLNQQQAQAPIFNQGEEVYVKGHGFDQIKAIYQNPCGDERAILLMNIMGNQSRMRVPLHCVSKSA